MCVEPHGDGAFHRQPDVIMKGRACDSLAGELREACIYLRRHLDRLLICGRLSFIRRLIALVCVVVVVAVVIALITLVVGLIIILTILISALCVRLILRGGRLICGRLRSGVGFGCIGVLTVGWLAPG